ncbi:MAG: methyl-accepting chemotaxis protein, partial [Oscillospiraceae bacterium]|nr:methyl-accepting chemotaxis protein [Oscillospiraceae bacterium]
VDQVAQVVQQNSATAEESAAAAEEMSGQSSIMNELVGRFKVKEGAAISYAPKVALPKGYDEPVPEPVTQSSQTYDVSDDNFGKY